METPSPRMDLGRLSVLLVDDNTPSLDLMQQILAGFRVGRVTSCRRPEEAWEHASRTRFDLIVLDGEMPDEDGISLARRLRAHAGLPNFTAPIILVSAHTPQEKVFQVRDAGANLVIKKPIAPAVLLSRIQWLARSPRQFITSETYNGPDRRIRRMPLPEGQEERRADALALTANADHAMSQDEVDALFG